MDGSVLMDWGVDNMEYRLVSSTSSWIEHGLLEVQQEVNQRLAEGYAPCGSLVVAPCRDGFYLIQPMTRVRPLPGNNRTTFLNNVNRVLR